MVPMIEAATVLAFRPKRLSEEAPLGHQTKRQRLVSARMPDPPAPSGPPPPRAGPAGIGAPPAHPQSINGILRRLNRENLYVVPIKWTERQLELLQCRFVREPHNPKENQASTQGFETETAAAASNNQSRTSKASSESVPYLPWGGGPGRGGGGAGGGGAGGY